MTDLKNDNRDTKNLVQSMFDEFKNKDSLELAKSAAFNYLNKAQDRNVFPTKKAIANLTTFEEPLPQSGASSTAVIKQLHEHGSPATVSQIAGRYFGLVNGGIIPTALAAKWLGDVWDQNTPLYLSSPIASKLEEITEQWIRELLDLPDETVAGFVSGSSMAIFCALAAARFRIFKNLDWDINADGMANAPKVRIVTGTQSHATVVKAVTLLGFGVNSIEWVNCDNQGRICADKMPQLDESCIVVLQAGNVNSGSFDDFSSICKKAKAANAWVHVDGAFGLWAAGCQQFKHLCLDMNRADSWSVDGHKTLNTPYDSGVVLCRDKDALVNALQASGSYITYSENRDGMHFTPEMSRRARVVELWATLKYLGKDGVNHLVSHLHFQAKYFADQLTKAGFTVLNEVVFNQVLVTSDNPETIPSLIKHIQDSGECWVGGTQWQNQSVIRVSVCSWATQKADIDRSVSAFAKARESLN